MYTIKILASIVSIAVLLFYFIGSVYVMKKYNGFRVFYNGLNRLFDYKGRAERIEYACICLLVTSISMIISEIFSLLNNPPEIFLIVVMLILKFTTLAVTTRRLHDLGYSGWLQAPIILIDMYSHSYSSEKFSYGGLIVLLFVVVGFELFLMFKEGQNTANKYGEKPNTLATS
ncbi:MAG: DUF805 domain-containing protein [Lonepinella koalarum]|nr:DUF805 domain-containing protein [Lonepinella koalarum]